MPMLAELVDAGAAVFYMLAMLVALVIAVAPVGCFVLLLKMSRQLDEIRETAIRLPSAARMEDAMRSSVEALRPPKRPQQVVPEDVGDALGLGK